MNSTAQKVFLAGLLHDIGKFYQRSDNPLFLDGKKNPDNEIGEVSFNLANIICPSDQKGRFGYHHVIWTSQFFENPLIAAVLKKVPGIVDSIWSDNKDPDNLVNLCCNHHKPETKLQNIVRLADWWSSGIDRVKNETFELEEKNESISWGKERYKKIPLYSVFNSLTMTHEVKPSGDVAFPLRELQINKKEHLFPKLISNAEDGTSQKEYSILWKKFIEDFQELPADTFMGFVESLIQLLRKYTWAIPSNTNDMSNVSLFDHFKTTAAFAHCLFTYAEENSDFLDYGFTDTPKKGGEGHYPVLLVGGDLSGIQNFIYNIASSKAAKSLKGRSFYIQLLMDTIVHKILFHPSIDATTAHVVYATGGKCYILLPNTRLVRNALDDIRKEIELSLWDDHKGRIAFLMDCVPFSFDSNSGIKYIEGNADKQSIGGLWKTLAEKLQEQKNKPFRHVVHEKYEELFNEQSDYLKSGNQHEICAVTGVELNNSTKANLNSNDPKQEPVWVHKLVKQQADLGMALKDMDYLFTYLGNEEEGKYLANRAKASINILGVNHYLFDKEELVKDNAEFRGISSADVTEVVRVNDTDFLIHIKGKSTRYGFRFYGGNEQAYFRNEKGSTERKNGVKNTKTFEEITQLVPGDDQSETYLGILRMDVDFLGDIFVNRIPDKSRTFAAYSTLSSVLDLFFSGYLNTIRNSEQYRDWVNILYSGGDDVFAIGRWDRLLSFAHEVRKEFRAFTGREDITISAGMVVVNNKFPISKAALMADEAEKKAKNLNKIEGAKPPKNAICIFGEAVSWQHEFDYVKEWKELFVSVTKREKLPKSLLHRVMNYSIRKKERIDFRKKFEHDRPDFSYKWQSAYYLKRFMSRYQSPEIRSLLEKLQIELFTKPERVYDLLGVAARWAELELKIEK